MRPPGERPTSNRAVDGAPVEGMPHTGRVNEPTGPTGQMQPIDAVLPGRIGMLVRIPVLPGMRPVALDVLNRYVDDLDQEPGTEAFLVCVDPVDQIGPVLEGRLLAGRDDLARQAGADALDGFQFGLAGLVGIDGGQCGGRGQRQGDKQTGGKLTDGHDELLGKAG